MGLGRLDRVGDRLLVRPPFDVEVEEAFERRRRGGAALQLGQVDLGLGERLEHLGEGARLVGRREHERGLVRQTRIVRQRLGRHDQEAREVVLPVGDVALEDVEAVALGGVLAGDGGARFVPLLSDCLGGPGRVALVLHVAAVTLEGIQEEAALANRLRVGADVPDVGQGGAGEAQQAVLDLQHLLADDVEARLDQQVVDARDGAGRRVLDRQQCPVRVAALERLDGASEGALPEVAHVRDGREVVPRGRVAVAALHALVRHADGRVAAGLPDGLVADRVAQDLAVQLAREVAVEARVLGERVDARQQVLLAVGVLDGQRAVGGLDGSDVGNEALTLGERVDEFAVDGVEVVAEGGEVGHERGATKKPAGEGGLSKGLSGACAIPSASGPPNA